MKNFTELCKRAHMLEQHQNQFTLPLPPARKMHLAEGTSMLWVLADCQLVRRYHKLLWSHAQYTQNAVHVSNICCHPGHFAKNCPDCNKDQNHKALGHSVSEVSQTSCLEVRATKPHEELTKDELSSCWSVATCKKNTRCCRVLLILQMGQWHVWCQTWNRLLDWRLDHCCTISLRSRV